MSYFRLHRERKQLQEKIPFLVEQENYEEASDVKKLIQLSFDNPREFLKKNISNIDINDERMDLVVLYDMLERITMSTEIYKKATNVKHVSFECGYNYHKEVWGSYPLTEEVLKMIEEDIGEDSILLEKIDYFILIVYECDLEINLNENKTYKYYKEFIKESEKIFNPNSLNNFNLDYLDYLL